MKTVLMVTMALIAGVCIGMNVADYLTAKSSDIRHPIPLPRPQSDSLDWDAEEFLMSTAIGQKCIDEGIIDTISSGERCIAIICGGETFKAEFPEAKGLIRDCYWARIYNVDLNKYYNDADLHKNKGSTPIEEYYRVQPGEWDKIVKIMKTQTKPMQK
ncbi:MAG: hypothetical protein LBH25_01090 [Fibromonadaceae bacterium]|nr:hypothetical protein [Fibromonadaceae bacterium]